MRRLKEKGKSSERVLETNFFYFIILQSVSSNYIPLHTLTENP